MLILINMLSLYELIGIGFCMWFRTLNSPFGYKINALFEAVYYNVHLITYVVFILASGFCVPVFIVISLFRRIKNDTKRVD